MLSGLTGEEMMDAKRTIKNDSIKGKDVMYVMGYAMVMTIKESP